MNSQIANELIKGISVLSDLKGSNDSQALDYVITIMKSELKDMAPSADYVNDNYFYNLNRTRVMVMLLLDVYRQKNNLEFNKNLNEVLDILNMEIEKEKKKQDNIGR